MQYKLINLINKNYSTIETVLTNRGIPINEVQHYLSASWNDINQPEALGENTLMQASQCLIQHITAKDSILVIVDCDCDRLYRFSITIKLFTWFVSNFYWK